MTKIVAHHWIPHLKKNTALSIAHRSFLLNSQQSSQGVLKLLENCRKENWLWCHQSSSCFYRKGGGYLIVRFPNWHASGASGLGNHTSGHLQSVQEEKTIQQFVSPSLLFVPGDLFVLTNWDICTTCLKTLFWADFQSSKRGQTFTYLTLPVIPLGHAILHPPNHLVAQVAAEGDALVLGGISQTPSYLEGKGKQAVQASVE